MGRAFVICPFGTKKDSAGGEIAFDRVHAELIGPAVKAAGLSGSTTGEIVEAGNIREDMFALIVASDLVVCDITILNANVFYELGWRRRCLAREVPRPGAGARRRGADAIAMACRSGSRDRASIPGRAATAGCSSSP